MAKVFPLVFYNLRVGRAGGQVEKEIRAILDTRPAVLGMCEATGYTLPGVEDYVKVRDTSNKSRANIAAYVKASLGPSNVQWHDLKQTWTRTAEGAHGQHEPRSLVEFRAGPLQVLVHHQPPKGTDNTKPAQVEGIDKLTARMAPWTRTDWDDRSDDDKAEAKAQPRVVLWDANRRPDEEGPGPSTLAGRIDGAPIGAKIDGAVIRGKNVAASAVEYPTRVSGVELYSDHGCMFRFKFEVPA